MRGFLRTFQRLHIWLLANVSLLALFYLLRGRQRVMTAIAEQFSMPLERLLGWLWSYVPFSGAELCYALAAVLFAAFLLRSIILIARVEYKREMLYRRVMLLIDALLSLYAAFCLLWGVNFYADDFCDRSGIYPEPVAYEDLAAVTRRFAEEASGCAGEVERDASGVCTISREMCLDRAPSLYTGLYSEFPFLSVETDPKPKGVYFSQVMSALDITGLYFPFTGECNLNMDFPSATFPFTVAHELAHRRGVASEQQCNFLGILASIRSDDPAYRYSGWLAGYIYLSNALYTVSPEDWREIRAGLPPAVEADLRAANDYWARYKDKPVSNASGKAYDAMLKSYGDPLGMQSYGAVADLLVTYFK